MEILFITNEMPYFTGGGMPIRDFNLLSHLSGRFNFTVVCYADNSPEDVDAKAGALASHCRRLVTVGNEYRPLPRWQSKVAAFRGIVHPEPSWVRALCRHELRSTVRSLVAERHFDIVHINHIEMGPLFAYTGSAMRVLGIEALVPKMQRLLRLETSPKRRVIGFLDIQKLRRYEHMLYRSVNVCTMASQNECDIVRRAAPMTRVAVIPNGVDTSYFQPLFGNACDNRPKNVLFVGSMAYQPNRDAVLYFYHDIWPLLKRSYQALRWQIIGRDIDSEIGGLASDDIEVLGQVRDVRPYMHGSSALIVPLRSGGGTRLKILEAMAAGLPVVSTSIGAEGIEASHDESIMLGDCPETFVEGLVKILSQPGCKERIARAARQLVEQRYEWTIIAGQLSEVYEHLCS